MRKGTSALAIAAVAAALVTVTGSGTAQAASTECNRTSLSFNLPGNPDMEGYAELCVSRINSTTLNSKVQVQLEGVHISGGKRFDSFKIIYHLERNGSTVKSRTKPWDIPNGGRVHTTSAGFNTSSSFKGGWTTDGIISYNINNDGKGAMTKELKGTPSIR
ncbi:hypothetical protein ACTWQF_35160 [Streptomyces sp. 8N114]|uniref:hypothetical protein n=1 Tax=Streptomyces sp. 8N114 TaxID=3457419 RepID=UPI003FCF1098